MPPEYPRRVLRISSEGGVRLLEVRELLEALETAYNGALIFQQTLLAWQNRLLPGLGHFAEVQSLYGPWSNSVTVGKRAKPVLLAKESFDSLVSRKNHLILVRVVLESPGSWDIAGIGSALEVVRKFIVDRSERRKDREYREPLERQRLILENDVLRMKALNDRIQLAKQLGATDEDLAPLINELLFKPLDELGRFQDSGLITGANLLEADNEAKHEGENRRAINLNDESDNQ
jgi:hypothetical protein